MMGIFSRSLVPIFVSFMFVAGCSAVNSTWMADIGDKHSLPVTQKAETRANQVNTLADSRWQLTGFQSMNDEIGLITPRDPNRFTMRLNRDGTVNMRLDCNHANGTWHAEFGKDGMNGSFEFGPLVATRALCPPPRLDERIVRDAHYVRGFLIKDGNLYLSLMADAGIYAWEPIR